MSELIFDRGGEARMRVAVDRPRLTFGNSSIGEVSLPDPGIAAVQFAIEQRGTRMVLVDVSGRGTHVDGEVRTEHELHEGAAITLGAWTATFRESTPLGSGSSGETLPIADDARPGTTGPVHLRIQSEGRERVRHLTGDELSIGKDAENQLVLTDPYVSSFHAQLSRQRRGFWVRDVGSTNGTFVNGARVREAELPLGAQLRVGETLLTLEEEGAGLPPPGLALGIVGNDPALRQILELIDRVAPHTAAVAIFGETGTGKDLVARAIHARSLRHAGPFVPLNCAALHADLIESELFGHEKGAFTGAQRRRLGAFEVASKGTLFLDEVGELPPAAQAKLLRVLESGEVQRLGSSEVVKVDVRIVAATHRDLVARCRSGAFREDLFYRLCVFPLHVPPLRQRPGDLEVLTDHFIALFRPPTVAVSVAPAARAKLASHAYRGNIRELRTVVQRALCLRTGPTIEADDIAFDPSVAPVEVGERRDDDEWLYLPGRTEEEARDEVRKRAIRRNGGKKTHAARELKVNRTTLSGIDAGSESDSD